MFHQFVHAASAALVTSETISRKPIAITMPKDSTRARTQASRPAAGGCGACQMRSSAPWSCAKTVVAPMKSVPRPVSIARPPVSGRRRLASSACTVAAPSSPIRPRSCPRISPRAASSPKASPATAMAISSVGAIENSV